MTTGQFYSYLYPSWDFIEKIVGMPKLKITTKALLQSIDNRTEWRSNAKQKLYAKINKSWNKQWSTTLHKYLANKKWAWRCCELPVGNNCHHIHVLMLFLRCKSHHSLLSAWPPWAISCWPFSSCKSPSALFSGSCVVLMPHWMVCHPSPQTQSGSSSPSPKSWSNA
jgi:hypothetical protein